MSNQNKQLYIVISQTGTLLSRILKQITGAEYNHASISLSRDLERMYSFGRRHPYNPFWGGFVIESPRTGTFKRFSETKVLVLSVSVTEEQHAELKEMLDVMWKRRRKYGYNYIGLCLAYFHIVWKQEGCYYCSEFVGELLTKSRVDGTEQLRSSIIQPMQFLYTTGSICCPSGSSGTPTTILRWQAVWSRATSIPMCVTTPLPAGWPLSCCSRC